jgi:polysaccharide biosynthesis transport protein
VLSALTCVLGAAIWTAAQPEPFRAECILQYERSEVHSSGGPADDLAAASEAQRTQDFLLTSDAVLDRVVKALKLDRDRGLLGESKRTRLPVTHALVMQRLKAHVTAQHVPGTRLVRVMVEDDDAQRAAAIANAISTAYLDHMLDAQMAARQRSHAWLSAQIETASARLQQLDQEIQTVLSEGSAQGLADEAQLEMLTNEIKSLSLSITAVRVQQIEVVATLAKLKAAHRDDPFDMHAREFDDNTHVQSLRAAYIEATLKLRELGAEDSDAGMERSELERRISGLYETTRRELDGIVRSFTLEATQAQSVEGQLRRSLDAANEAAAALRSRQLKRSRVDRERAEALRLLDTLRERASTVGMSGALGTSDAKVVAVADAPHKRESRPWARNLGLATLVGVALAAVVRRLAGGGSG